MKTIGLKKEVFGVDEPTVAATIAYGFSAKLEAIEAIAKYEGSYKEDVRADIKKVRIMRFKQPDGERYYFWGKQCNHCGHKNDGVVSFIREG